MTIPELIRAATDLRDAQRAYIADAKGRRCEAKGAQVGQAGAALDEAICRAQAAHKEAQLRRRDFFAAAALQGWMASSPKISGEALNGSAEHAQVVAEACVVAADAIIARLDGAA